MTELLAWVWLPLVVYALALGAGLLAETAARTRLPAALTPGVGLAVQVLLATAAYRVGLSRGPVLALVVLVAAAGFVLARRDLRERVNPGAAGLAALGVYVLYLAPVALSGVATFAGYNFTNDPSLNFTAMAWIAEHGYSTPDRLADSFQFAAWNQIEVGYPLGSHLLMTTVVPLGGLSFMEAYQPYIAISIAIGAMALFAMARSLGLPSWAAVGAAIVPTGANLLYVYGQLGGLKEVATVGLLATAAAVAQEAIRLRLRPGAVVLAVLPLAATIPVFSAPGAAYAGTMAFAVLVLAVLARVRLTARGWATAVGAAGATILVASFPSLRDAITFGDSASTTFTASGEIGGQSSTGVLGQLLRPLPFEQVLGIWFAEDWRLPVALGIRWDVNRVLLLLVAALAVAGVVACARRRAWGPLALLFSAAASAAVIAPRVSPYADSKLLIVLSPVLVFLALLGAWWVAGLSRKLVPVGIALAVLVGAGVAYSDAIVYREARLAPTDRLEALEDVGERAAGIRGLVTLNEWEEYGKYLLRDARVNIQSEDWRIEEIRQRIPSPVFGQFFDLDELDPAYVERQPAFVKRRAPDQSRPPASFRLAYANDWYELWTRRPGVEVREHLALQGLYSRQVEPSCRRVRALARRAGPGERLLAYRWRPNVVMNTVTARRSPGWVPIPGQPGLVLPKTPGQAGGPVDVPAGRYRVWVNGTSGRPIAARIDGREVGALQHVNTPEQWVQVGETTLSGGRHRLELRRPGGSAGPGDAYQGSIGPMFLEPVEPGRMLNVDAGDYRELCGQALDWVERVRGAA